MTDRQKKLMQKNAEGGHDMTEEIKARMISNLVRERYSVDAELAIIRQMLTKPEEFQAYFDYVEECKAKVKELIYGGAE